MIEKLLLDYKKKYKPKFPTKIESHSLNTLNKKEDTNLIETKKKNKQMSKNFHKRNILFNNKQSIINQKSTSSSSLSSSADKKYLTPTKYNFQNSETDYYFNESYNKTQELFNNANITRPKLDYNCGRKKNKNILLTIGTRINTSNNNNNNNYWKSKALNINRSLKVSKNKNKYVIYRKNFSNSNSRIKEDENNIESKSVEKYHNKQISDNYEGNLNKMLDLKNSFNNNINNIYNNNSSNNEKCFVSEDNNNDENDNKIKSNNIKNNNKERKYKNIVLRPHKIQKENKLKYNIKVNNYEIDDSPKVINKLMTRLNIKPKYSRVFKYK